MGKIKDYPFTTPTDSDVFIIETDAGTRRTTKYALFSEIMEMLASIGSGGGSVNLSNYYTKSESDNRFATKEQVNGIDAYLDYDGNIVIEVASSTSNPSTPSDPSTPSQPEDSYIMSMATGGKITLNGEETSMTMATNGTITVR